MTEPRTPTVLVRGEARRTGPPELAELTLTLRAEGPRAADVTETLAGRAARLRTVIEQHQDAIERSATSGLRVGPTIGRGSSNRPRGFQGYLTTTVFVHDFAALGDLIIATLAIEQATVDGPNWSLRPGSPLYREARLAAVADARARAEDYAAAFGAEITALLEVSDTDAVRPAPSRFARMSAPAGGAAEPSFELEPAEQEVTGQITVRFALSEPDLGVVSER